MHARRCSGACSLGGALSAAALVARIVPMVRTGRAARALDLRATQRWQLISTLVGAVALALRAWEIHALPFDWDDNAYGSVDSALGGAGFCAGQLSLLIALVSPTDRLSDLLFSAHMTKHEIIMVIAPPLVVLGRPWVALLFALPNAARARLGKALRAPSFVRGWRLVSAPIVAVALHALVNWVWHVPFLFEGAMRSEVACSVQHASFFGTAALFWWAILRGRHGRLGYGLAVALVFATAMHTSVLGALITVAGRLWYPIYALRGAPYQLDAREDQALAGIVMWAPHPQAIKPKNAMPDVGLSDREARDITAYLYTLE